MQIHHLGVAELFADAKAVAFAVTALDRWYGSVHKDKRLIMQDRTIELIRHLPIWVSQQFTSLTELQQIFFLVVAGFVFANLVLYFCTRGKEFAVVGLSAVLFLVPFVRFT